MDFGFEIQEVKNTRFSNPKSALRNPKSLLVIVFMPVLGVRPVLVSVCGRLMFMPVAVGDGLPHAWRRVIVVPVVVTMPVFVGNTLMMVEVGVFFEKQQGQ